MTREEATKVLKEISTTLKSWSGFTEYPQAIDMAIEALQSDTVQGCDGCRYNTRIPQKQCLCCKRYWRDGYERKGGDTE